MNLYLWETGQQNHLFTQEELCNLASVVAPLTSNKCAEEMYSFDNEQEMGYGSPKYE